MALWEDWFRAQRRSEDGATNIVNIEMVLETVGVEEVTWVGE